MTILSTDRSQLCMKRDITENGIIVVIIYYILLDNYLLTFILYFVGRTTSHQLLYYILTIFAHNILYIGMYTIINSRQKNYCDSHYCYSSRYSIIIWYERKSPNNYRLSNKYNSRTNTITYNTHHICIRAFFIYLHNQMSIQDGWFTN